MSWTAKAAKLLVLLSVETFMRYCLNTWRATTIPPYVCPLETNNTEFQQLLKHCCMTQPQTVQLRGIKKYPFYWTSGFFFLSYRKNHLMEKQVHGNTKLRFGNTVLSISIIISPFQTIKASESETIMKQLPFPSTHFYESCNSW